MTSIAEFALTANGFSLGRVLAERPELRFDFDRIVPADTFMPYFWVYGSNPATRSRRSRASRNRDRSGDVATG